MDYYSDSGHLFAKLFNSTELPEFMKQGELEDTQSLGRLPDSAFALPCNRQFPIHDQGHIYVSAAYAITNKTAEAMPAIEKAAAVFGISEEIKNLRSQIVGRLESEDRQKTASATVRNEFSIFFNGEITLQGRSDASLQKAAEFFLQNQNEQIALIRLDCAEALLKEASDRGMALPSEVEIQAGRRGCDVERMKTAILSRIYLVPDDRQKLIDMANAPAASRDDLLKIAGTLGVFDQVNGLDRYYGDRLIEPMAAVFNQSQKEANHAGATVKVGPREFGRDRWSGQNFDMWQQALEHALGKTAAQDLMKDGEPVAQKFAELDPQQASLLLSYIEA